MFSLRNKKNYLLNYPKYPLLLELRAELLFSGVFFLMILHTKGAVVVVRETWLWCRKVLKSHELESKLIHPITGKF